MPVRLDQFNAATNAVFKGIVQASVISRAVAVLDTVDAPEQHKGLARTILMGQAAGADSYINQFVWLVALNPKVIADSKNGYDRIVDTEVDAIVANNWGVVAS